MPLLRRARTTSRALLAVAAALLVVAGTLGGVAVHEQQQAAQARQVAAQMSAVLAATDAKQIDAGAARVIVSPSQGKAVFVGQKLPPVAAGHVLQLWLLDGGARSVGVIRGSTALLATGLRPGARLGVTVEPEGGSERPTTAPVMTMDLPV